MNIFELSVIILVCVLISSIISQILPKISPPLIQTTLGIILSLILRVEVDLSFDTDIFMLIFIGSVLYNEASNCERTTLIKNIRPILSLAIGLVVFVMLLVGFTLNWIVPSIPLAACFALGSSLGPTESGVVTSLPKNIKLGLRHEGILQGESFFNDASSIVSFQFAVAAVTTGSFSALTSARDFIFSFLGGVILGFVLGLLAHFILYRIRSICFDNVTFYVLFDMFMPFIVYFFADFLEVNGFIAIAVTGLVKINTNFYVSPLMSKLNIVSTSVWKIYTFTLNGFVFVLIGFLLPLSMKNSWQYENLSHLSLLFCSIAITICLYIARFSWILVMEYFNNNKKKHGLLSKQNIHSSAILTFGAAKAADTLSMLFAIPVVLENGQAFPSRQELIFIGACVVLISLILCNIIMPRLVSHTTQLQHKKDKQLLKNVLKANIEILERVKATMNSDLTKENKAAMHIVINSYSKRIDTIKKYSNINEETNIKNKLAAYSLERKFVINKLKSKQVSLFAAYMYLKNLDSREELLINSFSWRRKITMLFRRLGLVINFAANKHKKKENNQETELIDTRKYCNKYFNKKINFINNYSELCLTTLEHVIIILESEINKDVHNSKEILSIIKDYKTQLLSIQKKLPSFSSIKNTSKEIAEIQRYGFELEKKYITKKYNDGEIDKDEYNFMIHKVLIMTLDSKST